MSLYIVIRDGVLVRAKECIHADSAIHALKPFYDDETLFVSLDKVPSAGPRPSDVGKQHSTSIDLGTFNNCDPMNVDVIYSVSGNILTLHDVLFGSTVITSILKPYAAKVIKDACWTHFLTKTPINSPDRE